MINNNEKYSAKATIVKHYDRDVKALRTETFIIYAFDSREALDKLLPILKPTLGEGEYIDKIEMTRTFEKDSIELASGLLGI